MRVLVFIPTLDTVKEGLIHDLENQTLRPTKVIVNNKRYLPGTILVSPKVCEAMNDSLKDENLDDFDFILRVDGDWRLAPDFIEKNLERGIINGYAFSTEVYRKVFPKGLPPVEIEFILEKMMEDAEYRTHYFSPLPIVTRPIDKKKSWRYWYENGKMIRRTKHLFPRGRMVGSFFHKKFDNPHLWILFYTKYLIVKSVLDFDVRRFFEFLGYMVE